jgi:ferrous iron transport protein A
MASATLPFAAVLDGPSGSKPQAHPTDRCLATAQIGETVCVVALALEGDLGAWLRAVGIEVGERLTLLRRAAFGGPLHVRTRTGGEFALNVALARSIFVVADDGTESAA